MSNRLQLPIIEILKDGKYYRLDWDDHNSEADRVLYEKKDSLEGYIEGYFDALENNKGRIVCLASNTGTIKKLTKENAEKLKSMLERILYPIVTARYKKIQYLENLPEVKVQRKREGS
ncbi:hypothetical protein MJO52_09255 [Microbulbifer variabilis]|uniref:Uncharacterized protein n=1 Tax=Microbulbifer variabilis TaxID=266805 RepID=A0ABY4VG66_9GAMM|nr:hypothetical protein [Microbulbifer variabilis]USD23305.1 hypothetical protein MJO52_09255 [Microbulbifer variabilis]